MVVGTSPGKVILCGEHAVVYGRPAIAVPVWQAMAKAVIEADKRLRGCEIILPDIAQRFWLATAPPDHPVAVVVRQTLAHLSLPADPLWRIEATSQIPIASGLGSGAALSAALIRALFRQAGQMPDASVTSALVHTSEKIYHGTPSGIDSTVVAYERPVWYVRGEEPDFFLPGASFQLVIADSGTASPTIEIVRAVRQRWEADREQFEQWFDDIAQIVRHVRQAMQAGETAQLGRMFSDNHAILQALGVSTQQLDRLVGAAQEAGSAGAKVSGAGGGGNIIALVDNATRSAVCQALTTAGATHVIVTSIQSTPTTTQV